MRDGGGLQLRARQGLGQYACRDELAEVECRLVQRVVPAAFDGCADLINLLTGGTRTGTSPTVRRLRQATS